MATASGDAKGTRRPVMPYGAGAVVLALVGAAGMGVWIRETGGVPVLPWIEAALRPAALAAPPAEPPPPARAPSQGLKLPPRPAPVPSAPVPSAPVPSAPVAETVLPPPPPAPPPPAAAPVAPAPPGGAPPSGASVGEAPAAPADKPAPPKSRCVGDSAPWPADRTEQGKAIQGLLRDLGLYDGTVYGTVGPTTRAAIRKFQLATGQAETGEPDEPLFESLKKRCLSVTP